MSESDDSGEVAYVDPTDYAAPADGTSGDAGGDTVSSPSQPGVDPAAPAQAAPAGPQSPLERLVQMLRSTQPNPPVEEVGSFDDLKEHWQAYGLRGIQKAAGVDDAEAWIDLAKFGVGAVIAAVDEGGSRENGDDNGPELPGGADDPISAMAEANA